VERATGLTLSRELRRQMLSHARTAQPREAVGLLGGSARGEVLIALPLPNIAFGNRAFLADPYAQFCALRRLRAENLQLLAIYHSHPDGGVDPSHDDLAYAQQWPCAHLIVAIDTNAEDEARLRAFRYSDHGSIEEIVIGFSPADAQATAARLE
jgi:proteasome lid subunit RPN8/RPN11